MAQIDSINFCFKENTAWMDNCDSLTDYFPNFSGSMKYIIERVKEYGADKIVTTTTNNSAKIPTERRVKQICKACGYKYTDKSHKVEGRKPRALARGGIPSTKYKAQ